MRFSVSALFLTAALIVLSALFPRVALTDTTPGVENDTGRPVMYYYYSKDCDHCVAVKKEFLPDFLKTYGDHIEYREIEVSTVGALDSLYAMEDRIGIPEEDKDYPAVYFLGTLVEGEIPVRMRLEHVMKAYLANPDSMRALDREVRSRVPEAFIPETVTAKAPVHMAYFYKHGCKECVRAEEIVDWLKAAYPFIEVDIFNIDGQREKLLAVALGLRTGVPEKKLMSTPVFFIGKDYSLEDGISRRNLANLVESYAETGTEAYWRSMSDDELTRAESRVTDIFQRFTIFAIALAGLADGINPCAFATILFFVSYLTMLGRKGKTILAVGFAFAFSVFLTYFLVGLGFFNLVWQVAHFDIVAKILFGGTGILCIIFAFLSIGDYFKARSGRVSDMTLQLPAFLKRRIHATIREQARTDKIVIGAIIAGFMVSILEFACTGQVYLPTITLVVRQEGLTSIAVLYLLLYNLFFILPLLIVFGFVYFGMSSQGIARVMESNVGSIKLILALVFFVVGGLLIWTVL